MIPVALSELAELRFLFGEPTVTISALAVDSRLIEPGALFVPIRGRRRDGHAFIDDAMGKGATAVACAPGRGRPLAGVTVFEAAPLTALAAVASRVRSRTGATVIAVAGSAGKTSTKDILACLCDPRLRTVASAESNNNEIGLPLTLARVQPSTELVVCELGTGRSGEVSSLAAIAKPDIGVITAIGPEHLESFGSLDAVAAAEAELIAALPAGGTLVLPHAQPLLEPHRRRDLREITFGHETPADVHPTRRWPSDRHVDLAISVLGEPVSLRTNLLAPYQQLNLCAALAVCAALELPLQEAARSAAMIRLSRWRGQEQQLPRGVVVINDAYNANPLSMSAAIQALAERGNCRRTVVVLGEMSELGPETAAWHAHVGALAAQAGIDVVIAVGPLARHYLDPSIRERHWFPHLEAASHALPGLLQPADILLLKGSRTAGLEVLEAALQRSCLLSWGARTSRRRARYVPRP